MHRRKFLGLAGATLATGLSSRAWAQAQSWPERTVRLILPYAPGGATDAIGRPWADKLTQAFGQQFVIENRGGAAGMIGAEAAAKSAPDGYTLFLTPNAPLSVLPSLRKTPYDPVKSFEPVGRVGDVINGFVIHPSLGIKTFKEMVEYAKKNPGKLAYGSSGNGTANHLRLEMIKHKLGLDILHVPYRGGADTLNDVLPGTIAHDERAGVAAAREGRQADPARHQRAGAAPRLPRCPDADRTRRHRRRRARSGSRSSRPRARPRTSSPSSMRK